MQIPNPKPHTCPSLPPPSRAIDWWELGIVFLSYALLDLFLIVSLGLTGVYVGSLSIGAVASAVIASHIGNNLNRYRLNASRKVALGFCGLAVATCCSLFLLGFIQFPNELTGLFFGPTLIAFPLIVISIAIQKVVWPLSSRLFDKLSANNEDKLDLQTADDAMSGHAIEAHTGNLICCLAGITLLTSFCCGLALVLSCAIQWSDHYAELLWRLPVFTFSIGVMALGVRRIGSKLVLWTIALIQNAAWLVLIIMGLVVGWGDPYFNLRGSWVQSATLPINGEFSKEVREEYDSIYSQVGPQYSCSFSGSLLVLKQVNGNRKFEQQGPEANLFLLELGTAVKASWACDGESLELKIEIPDTARVTNVHPDGTQTFLSDYTTFYLVRPLP